MFGLALGSDYRTYRGSLNATPLSSNVRPVPHPAKGRSASVKAGAVAALVVLLPVAGVLAG